MPAKFFIATVLIMPILVGAGCSTVRPPSSPPTDYSQSVESTYNSQVFNLTLKDYGGKDVSLRSAVGKPLVINSWASWCPFCKKEIPDFISLQKEFGNRIKVIAINRGESLAVAKNYSDQYKAQGDLLYLVDPNDSFYQAIGAFSMPETIFVNAQGNIVDHKRGPMELSEMEQRVKKLLE